MWDSLKKEVIFRQPQQTLLLALACERLEIMNKNNNLWLSHFPPSHPVLDLHKSLFSGVIWLFREEEQPVSDTGGLISVPIFPLATL